ncbi:MAG: L-aspartate oxidase [bacterium]|nr:L-aspartate oxidase [bacterium]
MKHSEYSVIIVGSGAAGLYAALKLSSQINLPDGILLLTKSNLGESNSRYAQGGIVGVVHQNPQDSVDLHVKDTLKAGAGLSDEKVTQYISEASDVVINDLINFGVDFDKDDSGNINFTLEAAHSYRRILHVGGDATGKGITSALAKKVLDDKNITVVENAIATELLISTDNSCKGLIMYNSLTNEHEIIYSSATVLATGGVGQLYKYTTNPAGATGDGIALAYNAGAIIQDMEFVQFHPTALALSPESKNRFLISEAVRGEGAKLVHQNGEEFMSKYHDKRELAPRDVVTRAIYNEMQMMHTDNMYLNATVIEGSKLLRRFPTISKCCKENGIDITKMSIPVAPAAHYTMGGIKATVEGRTSISGLYAIGEVASTGLHGANRLASNSLLECVVCAYELTDYLSFANLEAPKIIDDNILKTIKLYEVPISENDYNISKLKQNLKELMWNNVGILRNETGLLEAKKCLEKFKSEFKRNRKCFNKDEYEYRNMLIAAELVIESALNRKESRGAHSRTDYNSMLDTATHTQLISINKKEDREFSLC